MCLLVAARRALDEMNACWSSKGSSLEADARQLMEVPDNRLERDRRQRREQLSQFYIASSLKRLDGSSQPEIKWYSEPLFQ